MTACAVLHRSVRCSSCVTYLLSMAPVLCVYIIGLYLCITRGRQYPRVSRLAFIGFSILLAEQITTPFLHQLLMEFYLENLNSSVVNTLLFINALNFAIALVIATAWAFLLVALFGKRDTHQFWLESKPQLEPNALPKTGSDTESNTGIQSRRPS
jgi:hypothetical protein